MREKLRNKIHSAITASAERIERRSASHGYLSFLSAVERDEAQRLGVVLNEYDKAINDYKASEAIFKAEQAERERLADERKAEAKVARERERQEWIGVLGSSHLQNAIAAGYNCQRLYMEERAAMEYPEYMLDFDDFASWRERSCPSEKALAEALRVQGEVVWLTQEATEDGYEQLPCEAVVVKLLGYWLYRIVQVCALGLDAHEAQGSPVQGEQPMSNKSKQAQEDARKDYASSPTCPKCGRPVYKVGLGWECVVHGVVSPVRSH